MTSELEREQGYLAMLYARLDELRAEAREQLRRVHAQDVGGNHQSRTERDAFARIFEDRIQALDEVTERLAFGRLHVDEADSDGQVLRYIGRLGLRDAEQRPILLDWRVPQAGPFYQATAARPLGVRARRHLMSKGRTLTRIEDEVFDPTLLEGVDESELQGESALLTSLTAERTGRMHDIVATIQAEQDRIIRSELAGVLVVQGGPGTGKTAVALHRAAYLLYSYRDRLRSTGVLVVGPTPAFLQYIGAVLPSLGETGVVLSSLGQLYPGVDASIDDAPDTAALKGSLEMVHLLERAVRSRQRVPSEALDLDVNGERLIVQPDVIGRAIEAAQASRKTHNEARVTFVRVALRELTSLLIDQLRRGGNALDEDDHAMLREDLRTAYDVRVALNSAWLPLTPEKLLQDLYARPAWLAGLTPRWSQEQRALLRRDRDAEFTISDVALLDEAAELLGPFDAGAVRADRDAKRQQKRDLENAKQAIKNMGVEGIVRPEDLAANFAERGDARTTAERARDDRSWTYGHVVVDEAQELSPLQWRVLRRRCPIRSMTVVGDLAQSASSTAGRTWDRVLAPLVGRNRDQIAMRVEELTVNYRTPAQITRGAEAVAIQRGLEITPSLSVREGDWRVDTPESDEVVAAAVAAVATVREEGPSGSIAVIATDADAPDLFAALAAAFAGQVGSGDRELSRPITLLTPREAKGLEFDAVVIVDPDAIATTTPRGASALYVSLTRPTQRLIAVARPGSQIAPVLLTASAHVGLDGRHD